MRRLSRSEHLINAWLDLLTPEQRDTAIALRDLVLSADPTLTPLIKWGNLMFVHQGTHAVAIAIHKGHANLQVFRGAALAERFPELEGSGKGMRHLKVRFRYPIDEELVREVVRACVEALPA